GLMHRGRECCRRPWLVVIFHEASELVLIIQLCAQMLPHRPRMPLAQPVVESLVVSVVEALLLHGPFEVPVHLGHEAKTRNARAHSPRRLGPERRCWT